MLYKQTFGEKNEMRVSRERHHCCITLLDCMSKYCALLGEITFLDSYDEFLTKELGELMGLHGQVYESVQSVKKKTY